MTKLSVNVNKVATLRNARGGNVPDVLRVALDCERFGADGITVHPRPDERHIRYADVTLLKQYLTKELNIEGNPREQKFTELVLHILPSQVTLVPDQIGQLTSDHGWDTITHADYLKKTIALFKQAGIRVSIFVDANSDMVKAAADTGTDRIELYTEYYAKQYHSDKTKAIKDYIDAAHTAVKLNLGINAGHDLNTENLAYFHRHIPQLLEVSIGHALIADALYHGLEKTIQLYKNCLR